MTNVASWLPGIFVALIGIVPGMLAWHQATQAKEEMAIQKRIASGVDARKVDQLAFESARSIYEAGLAEAQRQLAQRLEQILLRDREIGQKNRRIDALELALRQAGVPVPPEETP